MKVEATQILEEIGIAPRWLKREAGAAYLPRRTGASAAVAAKDAENLSTEKNRQAAQQMLAMLQADKNPLPKAKPVLAAKRAELPSVPESPPSKEIEEILLQPKKRPDNLPPDWQTLYEEIDHCKACPLYKDRLQAVPGVGDLSPDWVFVGEAPGAEEDKVGEPFVGSAGKLLDNMLAAIGLSRGKNLYIANAVKCRPTSNATPKPEEIASCRPWLLQQLQLLQPKVIVLLGKSATQSLLEVDGALGAMRGKAHQFNGIPTIVTYHPAYLLRNLPDKIKAWEDLLLAVETMKRRGKL